MDIKKPRTWLPQTLSILITLLLFAFLFEFTPEGFKWSSFLMALIPGLIALVFAALAWFLPKPGGVAYILAGIAYAVLVWGKVSIASIAILTGVCVVAGVLYFFQKKKSIEREEEISRQELPSKLAEPEEKSERFQEAAISPTGKTNATVKELTETKPTELPPLPPKTKKPRGNEKAKVDYEEPNFFVDAPTPHPKGTEEIKSQLLKPQPPEPKVELPTLSVKQEATTAEPKIPIPTLEKEVKLTATEDDKKDTPSLPPLPAEDVSDEKEAEESPSITEGKTVPSFPNEKGKPTELPPLPDMPKKQELMEAPETPVVKKVDVNTVLEVPEPAAKTDEVAKEYVESTKPILATVVEETAEEKTPITTQIPELSILEYPDDGNDEAEGKKGKSKIELEEPPEFQLPTEPEKKTIAPWKSTALDAGATTQAKTNDASMSLPDVGLTNKGPAPSGDTLAKSGAPVPVAPTQEGVNADFMQWTQK